MAMEVVARPLKVCVTGASGFIASHIVQQCLARGHTVRATVRDASNAKKTTHLRNLPGAAERLQLFSASLLDDGSFDEAIAGCEGVFHTASPVVFSSEDGENNILKPALEGTLNVLRSCKKAGCVKSLVVTSSMAAAAPVPAPEVKSEEHWSDPDAQKAKGNWYGCSKTLAEKCAIDFVAKEMPDTRLVTICPTMVVGPMLQEEPNATMQSVAEVFREGISNGKCRNDSMSYVDVRDCAAQHIAAMEQEDKKGRFMSVESSWHWNDIAKLLREIHPAMPEAAPCDGEPEKPTQFDQTRQKSLGVELRKVPEILKGAYEELRLKSML